MRLLLQRVTQASVSVDGQVVGAIEQGYLLFLCVMKGDTQVQARWLAEKVASLRLFDGSDGKINDRSLLDIGGGALVVSQFTLAADTGKGRRPDYTKAAPPAEAESLYGSFQAALRAAGVQRVESGRFAAYMQVLLTNDGPVTLFLEAEPQGADEHSVS